MGKSMLIYRLATNKEHAEAQLIKLFEYMVAGLVIVCSDFSLLKRLVEGNECGFVWIVLILRKLERRY